MSGRFNHALGLRLLWGIILLMVVTGYVKSYSLKQSAPETTPRYAKAWIKSAYGQNQLSVQKDKVAILPKDGWSNPFYYFDRKKILISAGKDERFGTIDDLVFPIFVSSCTQTMQDLIIKKIKLRSNDYSNLDVNTKYLKSSSTLIEGNKICPIPDFSGIDGKYLSDDDLNKNLVDIRRSTN